MVSTLITALGSFAFYEVRRASHFTNEGKNWVEKKKKKKTLAPRKEPKTVRDSQKMINLKKKTKKKKRVCAGMSRYVCVWNVDWKLFFVVNENI